MLADEDLILFEHEPKYRIKRQEEENAELDEGSGSYTCKSKNKSNIIN
jgi:hypothetical protein